MEDLMLRAVTADTEMGMLSVTQDTESAMVENAGSAMVAVTADKRSAMETAVVESDSSVAGSLAESHPKRRRATRYDGSSSEAPQEEARPSRRCAEMYRAALAAQYVPIRRKVAPRVKATASASAASAVTRSSRSLPPRGKRSRKRSRSRVSAPEAAAFAPSVAPWETPVMSGGILLRCNETETSGPCWSPVTLVRRASADVSEPSAAARAVEEETRRPTCSRFFSSADYDAAADARVAADDVDDEVAMEQCEESALAERAVTATPPLSIEPSREAPREATLREATPLEAVGRLCAEEEEAPVPPPVTPRLTEARDAAQPLVAEPLVCAEEASASWPPAASDATAASDAAAAAAGETSSACAEEARASCSAAEETVADSAGRCVESAAEEEPSSPGECQIVAAETVALRAALASDTGEASSAGGEEWVVVDEQSHEFAVRLRAPERGLMWAPRPRARRGVPEPAGCVVLGCKYHAPRDQPLCPDHIRLDSLAKLYRGFDVLGCAEFDPVHSGGLKQPRPSHISAVFKRSLGDVLKRGPTVLMLDYFWMQCNYFAESYGTNWLTTKLDKGFVEGGLEVMLLPVDKAGEVRRMYEAAITERLALERRRARASTRPPPPSGLEAVELELICIADACTHHPLVAATLAADATLRALSQGGIARDRFHDSQIQRLDNVAPFLVVYRRGLDWRDYLARHAVVSPKADPPN